jgi:hypothetical protein
MRLLLYVILGLILSGVWHPFLFIADLIFVFCGILFASLLNDYYDFKLQGEKNSIGDLVIRDGFSEKRVFYMIFIPVVVSFSLFYPMLKYGANISSMYMLTISFIFSLAYCAPPLRLKARRFIGIITPPVGIYLLFLQALFLIAAPGRIQWVIAIMVFIFSWYLDFIHLANDSIIETETHKISLKTAIKAIRITTAFGIVISLIILQFTLFGFIPLLFWIIRFIAIFNLKPENLSAIRKNILSRIYCIEEFAIYAIFVVLRISHNNIIQ